MPKKSLIFSAILVIASILSACQTPGSTVEPTWGIQHHRSPLTILDYIAEVRLDQTTRVEFLNPVTHEQVVITTKPTIQAIIDLLSSPTDSCAGTPESSETALLILMKVPAEGDEHTVSMDYRPVTSDVLLDNIPTGSWPVKIQGTYSVCPEFGRSLFELLDIDVSSAGLSAASTPEPTSTLLEDGRPTNPDASRLVESLVQEDFDLWLIDSNPPTAMLAPAPGVAYQLGEGWLHIHWYPDEQAPRQKAEEIVAEPSWAIIDWVARPHFFRCGTAIALYLGKDEAALAVLKDQCGAPFAPVERFALPPAAPTPSDLRPSSTPVPSPTIPVDLPVLLPSVQIGKGSTTALAVSPDGRWMAVGTQFGVYQYHAHSFEQAWFTPLPDPAGSLAFDPQSNHLGVSAGSGIVLLDVETGSQAAILEDAGSSFAWSPDGLRLVSGGGCEQVTVWDSVSGEPLAELRGDKCTEEYSGIHVTWAADGRIYAASMGTKILAWDGDAYTPVEDFSAEGAPDTWVSALLAAPTGSLFAQYDSMGRPVVAIVDGEQGRQVRLLDRGVNGVIARLSWAPDGERLAVNYRVDTGLTLIWNASTGQVEREIEGFYAASGLGWSPDERTLFGLQSLDGQIHAVEVSTGRSLRGLDGHSPAGSFLTWTWDGLASSDGATLTWWDPDAGQPLRREPIGSPQAWVISWPPGGPEIYLYADPLNGHHVGTDRYRRLLEGDEGQYPFPSAWSWDGSRLADPTRVWDVNGGELLASLNDPAQQDTPDQVAWSPDGRFLACGTTGSEIFLWDLVGDVPLSKLGGHTDISDRLTWSPDGSRLASVARDGTLLIWDLAPILAEAGEYQ